MALNKALCDLDAIPGLLESIRVRCSNESKWCIQAEELASKAKTALEQLTVYYEDEENDLETYKEPKEFRCLKSLEKHLDLLMSSNDLQGVFKEQLADLEMVELLLSFIDPSALNNYAIREASQNGHVAVVDRLLQNERVDPSAYGNDAIQWASKNGHVAVVDRLLQDERVDPSADNNLAIRYASCCGHLAVVDRLLQDERVDPSARSNSAICYASYNGHAAVVERLLQDERVDPSANNNSAIRWASKNGHKEVVALLKPRCKLNFLQKLFI